MEIILIYRQTGPWSLYNPFSDYHIRIAVLIIADNSSQECLRSDVGFLNLRHLKKVEAFNMLQMLFGLVYFFSVIIPTSNLDFVPLSACIRRYELISIPSDQHLF